jgi:glycosyltransferase involved in cell wall biosynthesis
MNILFYISSLSSGGAERIAVNLANYWVTKGDEWKVTIVTLDSIDNDFYKLHPSVKRISLNLLFPSKNLIVGLLRNVSRIIALRHVLDQTRPAVAISLMDNANVLLSFAAYGFKDIITIGSEHTHPPIAALTRMWQFLRAWRYGNLDSVVALTDESARWLRKNTSTKKVVTIPNSVNFPLDTFSPIIATHLLIPKDTRIILAVGRLVYGKGFDMLITAYAKIASNFSDTCLVILGCGGEKERLIEQVRSLNIEHKVIIAGPVGNIGEWYNAAYLYVMSSRFEGFGNTLIEAMAHGLPVISFDCDTGPRNIINHEINGLLVQANDISALSLAIKRLLSDKELHSRIGNSAIEARDRFSIQNISKEWEKLFFKSDFIKKGNN